MAIQQFVNNFAVAVDANFGSGSTNLQLTSTAGLPVLAGGDYLFLTLYRLVGNVEQGHEVVKVTAINGNICTVERSVEGAAASAFSTGDPVEARLTAKGILAKADIVNTQALLDQKASTVYVDTLDALKAPLNGVGASGTWGISITGNAATATKLAAARTINGIAFDGTANITLAKSDIGLGNVDNTSDVSKPVSTAQAAADALALPKTGGSMGGSITGQDNKVIQMMLQDIGYTAVDKGNSGTATVTFDFAAGCKQKVTATGSHTFAFSNWPPAGNEGILRVDFFNYGAFAITPPTVTWTNPDGSETTSLSAHFTALAAGGGRSGFTAAGNTKAIFWSSDAGATVYGRFI